MSLDSKSVAYDEAGIHPDCIPCVERGDYCGGDACDHSGNEPSPDEVRDGDVRPHLEGILK